MLKRTFAAAALLMAAGLGAQAQARSSTGWTVIGTITPSPCVLTLSGGGVADFGPISTGTIKTWPVETNPQRYSGLDANVVRSLDLHVGCTSPTRFALSFVDNRAGTVSGPAGQGYSYGLGSYTSPSGPVENIGRYVVSFTKLVVKATTSADAIAPQGAFLTDGAATAASTWTRATGNDDIFLPSGKSLGFTSLPVDTAPGALADVSGPIDFSFEPLQAVVDGATSDILLDGSATITLIGL
ncbi:DUF1120 domain-containing protein [Xylophilus rhododendri]|uniref:DUF1120 domain-containing protein n=1 Tax=Xylophilus rhododendri TaxID=2697032 RepID=A0A857J458_9BURK|nr:DUF1120 domain-containing protein [Xylophilus rhododendri]QHI98724.1 DUF1120 domain-containing protein [Xylophilus rhododendri]